MDFYRATMLHHNSSPEQTNLFRAHSAFHVFTSSRVKQEGSTARKRNQGSSVQKLTNKLENFIADCNILII